VIYAAIGSVAAPITASDDRSGANQSVAYPNPSAIG
jgi:hypothetical protein